MTNDVLKVAKYFNVPVEAEIGELLRLDNGVPMENKNIANPDEVREFLSLCKPDTLAIGIGNAHGYYRGTPDIHLEILEAVRKFTDIPLVLHGCTGMADSIVKEKLDYQGHSWKLSQYASDALTEDVKKIIELSGSAGTV